MVSISPIWTGTPKRGMSRNTTFGPTISEEGIWGAAHPYPCSPCCGRRTHEAGIRRDGNRHCGLRTEASTTVVRPRSGPRRADPRDPHVDEYQRVYRGRVRRGLYRRVERWVARAVRDPLRQGQPPAAARRVLRAVEQRGDAARSRRLERGARPA